MILAFKIPALLFRFSCCVTHDRGFAAVPDDITDIESKMATKDDIAAYRPASDT
jgi:hypothetical protein